MSQFGRLYLDPEIGSKANEGNCFSLLNLDGLLHHNWSHLPFAPNKLALFKEINYIYYLFII